MESLRSHEASFDYDTRPTKKPRIHGSSNQEKTASTAESRYQITFDNATALNEATILRLQADGGKAKLNVKVSDLGNYLEIPPERIIQMINGHEEAVLSSLIEEKAGHMVHASLTKEEFDLILKEKLPPHLLKQSDEINRLFLSLQDSGHFQLPHIPRSEIEKQQIEDDLVPKDPTTSKQMRVSSYTATSGHTYFVLKDVMLGKGAYKEVFINISVALDVDAYSKSIYKASSSVKTPQQELVRRQSFISTSEKEIEINEDLRGAKGIVQIKHYRKATSKSKNVAGNPSPKFYIDMEVMNHGSLISFIKESSHLKTPDNIYRILKGIGEGMESLEKYSTKGQIIHRDIKADNIFLHQENGVITAKIADMGLSEYISESVDRVPYMQGTPAYFAPEYINGVSQLDRFKKTMIMDIGEQPTVSNIRGKLVDVELDIDVLEFQIKNETNSLELQKLRGEQARAENKKLMLVNGLIAYQNIFHPKVDMWAVGIVLYQLRIGKWPPFLINNKTPIINIISKLTQLKDVDPLFAPEGSRDALEELNWCLLSVNPNKRPSPQEFTEAVVKAHTEYLEFLKSSATT